jgi:acyl carrier protein
MDVFAEIKKIIVNQLDCDEDIIDPEEFLVGGIAADEWDIVEVVTEIKNVFGINLTIEDFDDIESMTVGDLVKLVSGRLE